MPDVTGTIRAEHDGKTYALRLTMRSFAELQAKHGANVAGILDGTAGAMPSFAALIDVVSLALQRAEAMPAEEADRLADELLTADIKLVERLIAAAFPDAEGNGARPAKKSA